VININGFDFHSICHLRIRAAREIQAFPFNVLSPYLTPSWLWWNGGIEIHKVNLLLRTEPPLPHPDVRPLEPYPCDDRTILAPDPRDVSLPFTRRDVIICWFNLSNFVNLAYVIHDTSLPPSTTKTTPYLTYHHAIGHVPSPPQRTSRVMQFEKMLLITLGLHNLNWVAGNYNFS